MQMKAEMVMMPEALLGVHQLAIKSKAIVAIGLHIHIKSDTYDT
jgi:hypothetical protein